MQQQLIGLALICVIFLVRMASISVYRDSDFATCLGYNDKLNDTHTMDKEALAWIDYSLKGMIVELFTNPTESIAQSGVELFGYWECLGLPGNLTFIVQ